MLGRSQFMAMARRKDPGVPRRRILVSLLLALSSFSHSQVRGFEFARVPELATKLLLLFASLKKVAPGSPRDRQVQLQAGSCRGPSSRGV